MHCIYRKGALSNPSLKPYFQDGKTWLLSRLKQFPGFLHNFLCFPYVFFTWSGIKQASNTDDLSIRLTDLSDSDFEF